MSEVHPHSSWEVVPTSFEDSDTRGVCIPSWEGICLSDSSACGTRVLCQPEYHMTVRRTCVSRVCGLSDEIGHMNETGDTYALFDQKAAWLQSSTHDTSTSSELASSAFSDDDSDDEVKSAGGCGREDESASAPQEAAKVDVPMSAETDGSEAEALSNCSPVHASDNAGVRAQRRKGEAFLSDKHESANRARWADLLSESEDEQACEAVGKHPRAQSMPSVDWQGSVDIAVSKGKSAPSSTSNAWLNTPPRYKGRSGGGNSSDWWSWQSETQTSRSASAWRGRESWETRRGHFSKGWSSHSAHRAKRHGAAAKWQCQFIVGIEEEPKFRVTRKLLGSAGANMKAIAGSTDAKLRLRGRGSNFLEGPEQQESQDPLMLCVSATDEEGYKNAVSLVTELMERVYVQYREFCSKNRWPTPQLRVQVHQGARAGAR